jgi:hypothetical protein
VRPAGCDKRCPAVGGNEGSFLVTERRFTGSWDTILRKMGDGIIGFASAHINASAVVDFLKES